MINLKVAAETPPDSSWVRLGSSLLCTHQGSISEKANKIREELHIDHPKYSWYISILEGSVGYALHYTNTSLTGFKMWAITCGYKMFIWYKADSQIDRVSCSSEEISKVENIIRIVDDSKGLSSDNVIDEIVNQMKVWGIQWHLIFVNDIIGKSHYAADLYSFCHAAKHKYHDVFVYFK